MLPKIKHKGFLEFIYDFFGNIMSGELILAFEGGINHEVMKTFTNLTEHEMNKMEEDRDVRRRVYHVMVECMQNIAKHAFQSTKDSGSDMNHGILMVTRDPERFNVVTGNIIENCRIEELGSMLDEINSLDQQQLNELFKQQLVKGEISDKGGAGLGLIDIKRKTGNNFEFHFLPVDNLYSFFILTSVINRT